MENLKKKGKALVILSLNNLLDILQPLGFTLAPPKPPQAEAE